MENFMFKSGTRIIFGKGAEKTVGEYVVKHSRKVLVHYGGDYLKEFGILDRITKSLEENGIEYVVLDGVVPNPRLSLVRKGIKICKEENIDFVLAIGGGSAIDSSKAIAVGTKYDGDVWDFYSGKTEPKSALKVGTVLTIPGSGSEMSESSIITNEEKNLKCGIDCELIVPEFSILNPEMCYTIPPYLMSCGIADILSHLFERYFTPTKSAILSDHLLEGAMKAVLEVGPRMKKEPKNYDNCSEIMWLATVSHNGMLDAGRISDWGSHRIEHEISALYDITHGAGMAIIFPAWMKYVKHQNMELFAQLATRVFGVADEEDKDVVVEKGIICLEKFFKSLGLKTTLTEAGVPVDRFEEMAMKAVGDSECVGRFKQLKKEDIVEILKLAI
ncbi:iron-containing alcohol dehydrogenase [Clostridium aestuarii]|uniref:Iron-containing alcohol dehydrogenase n=1 Tax=Clostridium aestuarii TaxID=338193 RepID=A0ABT4CWP0_9CLOT|nr:iron-containing alcohol dehydrogenase [Clostridium aestuarii]MCY6483408.1 iron-containing alcohol dehydrogenase [Clostridium aestuarii]